MDIAPLARTGLAARRAVPLAGRPRPAASPWPPAIKACCGMPT